MKEIDNLKLTTSHNKSLCGLFEGFQLAREILESYNELRVSLQDHLQQSSRKVELPYYLD